MKRIIIYLIIFLQFAFVKGQDDYFVSTPNFSIGLGTGINGSSGIVGVNLEYITQKDIGIMGGLGLGMWGYKGTGLVKVYTKGHGKGISYNAGISMSSGISDVEFELETVDAFGSIIGMKQVDVNLLPSATVNFLMAYHWMFREKNRFYLEFGYSLPVTGKTYEIITPNVYLSDASKFIMQFLQPGGITIGLGFTFGQL